MPERLITSAWRPNRCKAPSTMRPKSPVLNQPSATTAVVQPFVDQVAGHHRCRADVHQADAVAQLGRRLRADESRSTRRRTPVPRSRRWPAGHRAAPWRSRRPPSCRTAGRRGSREIFSKFLAVRSVNGASAGDHAPRGSMQPLSRAEHQRVQHRGDGRQNRDLVFLAGLEHGLAGENAASSTRLAPVTMRGHDAPAVRIGVAHGRQRQQRVVGVDAERATGSAPLRQLRGATGRTAIFCSPVVPDVGCSGTPGKRSSSRRHPLRRRNHPTRPAPSRLRRTPWPGCRPLPGRTPAGRR